MKIVFAYLIFVIIILSGCSNFSDGPKNTYYEFEDLCANGDQVAAKLLVSEQDIEADQKLEICDLVPNNYYKLFESNKFRLDDPDPKVEIHGGIALLKWKVSDSKIIMIMDKIDGVWKIRTTMMVPLSTSN